MKLYICEGTKVKVNVYNVSNGFFEKFIPWKIKFPIVLKEIELIYSENVIYQ